MSFKVGDKVVYVDDNKRGLLESTKALLQFPVLDEIYTIRGFSSKGFIYLKEIDNSRFSSMTPSGKEPAFKPYRFRKVKLDYDFVEQVIKQVKHQTVDI